MQAAVNGRATWVRGSSPRMTSQRNQYSARSVVCRPSSEWADRKIAQPQVGEAALLPNPEQRPVEREPQRVVAALYRDPDALAEITALRERAADEGAAIGGIGAVEPERQRDAVPEQQVDLAPAQRLARRIGAGIRA